MPCILNSFFSSSLTIFFLWNLEATFRADNMEFRKKMEFFEMYIYYEQKWKWASIFLFIGSLFGADELSNEYQNTVDDLHGCLFVLFCPPIRYFLWNCFLIYLSWFIWALALVIRFLLFTILKWIKSSDFTGWLQVHQASRDKVLFRQEIFR